MIKFKYFLFFFLFVLFTSCSVKKSSVPSISSEILFNSSWQIKELNGVMVSDTVNGKIPILTLDIKDSHYSFITGCNNLNGRVELLNNQIKFFNGISTMMFCDEMTVEDGFKSVLPKITTYKIFDDELVMYAENKVVAKFVKFIVKDNFSLVDSKWELDLLSSPGVDFKTLYSDKKPNLEFFSDNRLSGYASCNRFNSSFKIDGNSISFGSIMSTKMMCQNIESERVFLNLLSKINKYSVNENQLLFMIDDIVVMRFKKI